MNPTVLARNNRQSRLHGSESETWNQVIGPVQKAVLAQRTADKIFQGIGRTLDHSAATGDIHAMEVLDAELIQASESGCDTPKQTFGLRDIGRFELRGRVAE